jgi:hypothetical protein
VVAELNREITVVAGKQWTCEKAVEALLDRLGMQWEYVAGVCTGLIDQVASLQNQARIGVALKQDTVVEYAVAMLEGAVFPALVAFPLPNGTYILAGGNHRFAAAREAGRTTVDLYVIRSNDEAMRRLITVSLNTLNGIRPDRADTLMQAVQMVQQYNRQPTFVAAHFGLPLTTLTAELRAIATRNRLRAAGVSTAPVAKTHLDRMAQLENDNVLREVAVIQSEVQLPDSELRKLIADVKGQRTEAGQLAVVQQWRDRDDLKLRAVEIHKGRGAVSPVIAARATLMRALSGAQTALRRHVTRSQAGLSNDGDYQRALEAARQIVAKLEALNVPPA